ncbi:MAG TPA: hypothetical protein VGM63_01940 [Mucilaginibacter sp.]|jgi:hypothetical protein
MNLVAEIRKGKVIVIDDSVPEWITAYLGQHIKPANNQEPTIRGLSDLDAVRKKYEELKKK